MIPHIQITSTLHESTITSILALFILESLSFIDNTKIMKLNYHLFDYDENRNFDETENTLR